MSYTVEVIREYATNGDGDPATLEIEPVREFGEDSFAAWVNAEIARRSGEASSASTAEELDCSVFHDALAEDERTQRAYNAATGVPVATGPASCPQCGTSLAIEQEDDGIDPDVYAAYAAATGVPSAGLGGRGQVEAAREVATTVPASPAVASSPEPSSEDAIYMQYAAATGVRQLPSPLRAAS